MVKPILEYRVTEENNPQILKEKTVPVADFCSDETQKCIQDLNDTLDEYIRVNGNKRGACGLSSNQIGYTESISVMQMGDERIVLGNPVIISKKGYERLFRIGCFSVPQYRALVRYNDDITVKYKDENGIEREREFTGDRSCVTQHEMDHLEGMLLFDRLENGEKDLFVPKETLYADGVLRDENRGSEREKRRRERTADVLSAEEFYSSLFNDYSDYRKLRDKTMEEHLALFEKVKSFAPNGGKILELGDGTGALAAAFGNFGYRVTSLQRDADMAFLAKSVSDQCDAGVNIFTDPKETGNDFNVAYSFEVPVSLERDELIKHIQDVLTKAPVYAAEVPTIETNSNMLRGNEILRTVKEWTDIFADNDMNLICEETLENGYYIFVIGRR